MVLFYSWDLFTDKNRMEPGNPSSDKTKYIIARYLVSIWIDNKNIKKIIWAYVSLGFLYQLIIV